MAVSCEHDNKCRSSTEGGEILIGWLLTVNKTLLHAVRLLVVTLDTELIQCGFVFV